MIGYAMLYTIVVSVPLVAAAMFVAHFLQTHGRAERGVWIMACALTLVVPAIMLSRPAQAPADAWPPVQVELVTVPALPLPAQAAASSGAPPSTGPAPIDLDALLLGAWILASLALAARWIVSAVRLNRVSRSWLTETVEGVQVWLAPELGPAVTGVIRPRVVVPAWVPALSDEQRALVLVHEQEHVRARDPWLITIARLTRIITPWNPATWLLSSRLKRAVELDCDRRVLRRHPSVEAYGQTLLAVAARGSHRLLSAASFAESDVPLRKRILAMTTPPRAVSAIGVLITVAVGSTLVSSAIAVPVPAMRVLPAPAVVLPGLVVDGPEEASADAMVESSMEADTSLATPAPVDAEMAAGLQLAPQVTREPQVISDPRRPRLRLFSLWEFNPQVAVVGETGVVAPDGRWFRQMDASHPADSLNSYTRDNWGIILPLEADSVPAKLTENPRIVNLSEIELAIRDAYPPSLREAGIGGTVAVQFLVAASGEVEGVRLGQISAYTAINEAALAVAEVYRFSPAMVDQEPIPVWVSHAISFYPPQ